MPWRANTWGLGPSNLSTPGPLVTSPPLTTSHACYHWRTCRGVGVGRPQCFVGWATRRLGPFPGILPGSGYFRPKWQEKKCGPWLTCALSKWFNIALTINLYGNFKFTLLHQRTGRPTCTRWGLIVTTKGPQEFVCDMLNVTIFNDVKSLIQPHFFDLVLPFLSMQIAKFDVASRILAYVWQITPNWKLSDHMIHCYILGLISISETVSLRSFHLLWICQHAISIHLPHLVTFHKVV